MPDCRGCGCELGLNSLKLAALAHTVYAFEINGRMTKDLQYADLPNVHIVHTGLSDSDRSVMLYVPMPG